MAGLRVLITGATGLVGGALVEALLTRGDRVRALTRRPARPDASEREGLEFHQWDGMRPAPASLRDVDVVVHLAGEPILGGLPTRGRLDRMVSSRVDSTRAIVERIGELEAGERPKRLVCASAVGIYGDRGDERLDEASPPGSGFLADLCRDWEAAAEDARTHGLAVTRLRLGVILSRHGGALPAMRLPFEWYVGGVLGSGKQWVPWVHLDDVVQIALLAIDDELDGVVNVVAPNPATNRELTDELARRLRRPALIPVPAFALRLALNEISGELLGSKYVAADVLDRARYRFVHHQLGSALDAELDVS